MANPPNGSDLPPDQDARDLMASELDKNLLVEAAAGTGKTTSLVTRMINLIREGKSQVDKLAAVTFTRKAAAELRARFQVGLERAARDAAGFEKERLAEAVRHVERAFLGTIHSFCARLLRERPVEAGVDSDFTELDDALDHELRLQAWAGHVELLIGSSDPLLGKLEDLGVEIGQLSSTFERFAEYPDVDEWPSGEIPLPDPEPALTALRNYVAHIKSLEPSLPKDAGNDKLIPEYRRLVRAERQADFRSPAALLAVLAPFMNKTPVVVQKNWPGGKPQALKEVESWDRFGQFYAVPYVQALRRVRYDLVLKTIRPAVELYDRLRRDAGGLNFQDLLLLAARMLREHPATRSYFRKRFTHLLIDEFQDTDPIQAEVMMLLAADDPGEPYWRRCRPASGSLFVVGDPKQSIYRFRRADIVTYNEVKRIILATGGRVVSLTANFRATAPLVEWVNGAFAKRFPAEAREVAPVYSPLQVGRVNERAGDLAGLCLFKAAGANKQEILANESLVVARTIRQALDSARKVPRSQRERDEPDAAQPGDFLIVTRNTTNLSRYARELEALGVPHQVTGGTTLNELEELALLCTCLRALVRPDDPVALVAALRSELFGISDTALYEHKRAGGHFSFRRPLPENGLSKAHREAMEDALSRLSLYYKWLYLLPAPASIEKIADHLGLVARAACRPGGDFGSGSLAKAFELVRFAQRDQLSMLDLLDYLERLVAADQKYDGISARAPDGPVVRLMNLHKVKGLEAPVVFLTDPTGYREHPIELHIDRSGDRVRGYMAVYAPRPATGFAPPRMIACPSEWPRLEEAEQDFLQAEEERLLYVAATRAGTWLVVTQREQKANENPWRTLADDLSDQATHEDPGPQLPPARPQVTVSIADIEAAQNDIKGRWDAARQATYETEKIKEISLIRPPSFGGSQQDAAPGRDVHEAVLPAGETPTGEHGVEWGEDIHALLEAAMRKPDANLASLARSLSRERDRGDDRADELLASVRKIMQSAIWKRAQASPRVLAEVPLMMMSNAVEAGTRPSTLRRGVIDLAFLEADEWVIVDYKTDRVEHTSLAKLVEHYRPQVQNYAHAWGSLLGQPVHEVGLFFTHPNRYECWASPGT
jgi:ATP-dependent helicase/nuclease subunit A